MRRVGRAHAGMGELWDDKRYAGSGDRRGRGRVGERRIGGVATAYATNQPVLGPSVDQRRNRGICLSRATGEACPVVLGPSLGQRRNRGAASQERRARPVEQGGLCCPGSGNAGLGECRVPTSGPAQDQGSFPLERAFCAHAGTGEHDVPPPTDLRRTRGVFAHAGTGERSSV
jgi:hypothetical protein